MNKRNEIYKIIKKNTSINNVNGYVKNYKDNLLTGIEEKYFVDDLLKGSGNELDRKFKALWSSSALAVNNFVPIKMNLRDFSFLNYSEFTNAGFERKFPTGLNGTPPNLDFYLENQDVLIAFESKYLETFIKTKLKFAPSYFTLKDVNKKLYDLINKYNNQEHYLDIAQLIKHSLGLLKYKTQTKKEIILVYIYWEPINCENIVECKIHAIELKEFTQEIEIIKEIKFESIAYNSFWELFENNNKISSHIQLMREKYNYKI